MQADTHSTYKLDQIFIALADRNRRAMIDQLSAGPASVSDLAKPLHIVLPSALKHPAVLEEGGIVRSSKSGRVRTYHIKPDAFSSLEAWVAARKASWSKQFDRLETYLRDQSK